MVDLGTLIHQAKAVRCGEGNYPVLSMTMHDGLVFQNDKFKKTIASKDKSDYKVVKRNQLVISFPIDEGVLATQRIIDAGIVSPAYGIWDIDQEMILPEFLEYALRCDRALNYYKAKLRGSTARRRSLPTSTLLAYTVPLPDISEQEHILNVVHKTQKIISGRTEEISLLDNLIKARFVELFGDPNDNPKGYSKKQLKDTCRVITGNTPSRAVSEYYGEHIEWIKTDNIVSGLLNPTTATESLSEKGMAVSRTVESGAILMVCIAGSIASIGRVCVTDRKVSFNQQINAIVPSDYNILFLYVMLQISKEYLVDEINMALKGILSKSKLEEKAFYVPPIELQEQFAAFVEQTDKSKVVEAIYKANTLFITLNGGNRYDIRANEF